MSLRDSVLGLALLSAFGLIALGGCNGDSTPSKPSGNTDDKQGAAPAGSPQTETVTSKFVREEFSKWPQPLATLALTGEMHGYIEPCGCSEPQYGGIARRDELFRQLREKGWHLAGFDLGGSLKNSRQQSQIKFRTLLDALRDMRYQSIVLGVEELKLGAAYLLSQDTQPEPGKEDEALRFLAANVVLFGDATLPTPIRQQIVKVGDKKIGVTAVFGEELKLQLGSIDPSELSLTDPATAIKTALEKLNAEKPDLLVLLSHATLGESQRLAKQFPEFHVVVTTGSFEEPLSDNPSQIGDTLFVSVGKKGKFVGLLGLFDDPKQPFRFDLVRLDGKRFPESKRMIEHMRFYQDLLRDSQLAESENAINHPKGDKFVGAEKCSECHTKAFAKWKETGHAQGFESLKKGRLGLSRIYDPECLSCHVTGWHPQDVVRFESGFENAKKSAHLMGNQCENCHGPGSRHISLIEADKTEEAKMLMRLTLAEAEKNVCSNCHDLDNSPHFKFDEYWKKIAHPGRD